MQNRNDNFSYLSSLTGHEVAFIDPMTRRELGHFARQEAMGRFLVDIVKSLGGMIRNWASRIRQFEELNGLPDYLLKDMGFTRDQISQVLSNELQRPEMSLSPSGPQSAPAFSQSGKDAEESTPQAA